MKNIVFTIILLFSSLSIFAQAGKLKKADDLYLKLSYAGASELYESLLGSEVDSPELKSKLANCFFQVGKLKESEDLYSTLVKGNVAKNDDLYAYAQVLKQNGKYAESDKWMKKYNSIVTSDSRGREFIENENYIQMIEKNGNKFSINNLDVNTVDADFGGYIYKNKAYFITSRYENSFVKISWTWNEKKFLDLYRVELGDSQQFVDPKIHTKRVNTKFHEGPITFTPDGKKVFYTRNNIATGSERRDQKGIQNLKIYIADVIQDNIWLNEREFIYNSKEYSIGHPSITSDGKTLYFVSDMPGGYGAADIYRVQILEDEKFGKPENLGKTINTEGKEMFPFINNENLLFFSSDGHVGLGGLDVFVGIPSKNTQYNKILNVGTPVNSRRDDFAFVMDSTKRMGYFSSNREGGKGDDDIYSYLLEKPFKVGNFFNGTIVDDKSGDILTAAKVILKDLEGNIIAEAITDKEGKVSFPVEVKKDYIIEINKVDYIDYTYKLTIEEDSDKDEVLKLKKDPGLQLYCLISEKSSKLPLENVRVTFYDINSGETFIDTITGITGDFLKPLFDKQLNDELNYEITLEKEGYLTLEKKFNFKIEAPGIINVHEKLDFRMSKVEIGSNLSALIDINPIYFDLGKWYIRNDAKVELDKVVEIMNKYPEMVIELGSHTDCRSSKAFNLKLSDKRAKSSAEYIKSKITNPKRIYGKGYGEAILINDCGCEGKIVTRNCSEEEHQENRRTEFIIKKIGVANVSVNTKKEKVTPKLEIDYTKKFHIVQESDNLYIISVNNGVSVEELMKLNNMKSQKVTIGQKIILRKEKVDKHEDPEKVKTKVLEETPEKDKIKINKKDEAAFLKNETSGKVNEIENQVVDKQEERYSDASQLKKQQEVELKKFTNDTLFKIKSKELKVDDELTKEFKLNPIYYDLNSSYFRVESRLELEKVVKILNENKKIHLLIKSHTDCKDSHHYNQWLSERRANRVLKYIVAKIENPNRIKAKGFGETELINECDCKNILEPCSDEKHQQNRRTEFVVIKIED